MEVVIIPREEWLDWMARQEKLEKKVAYLERGLTAWVGTEEATRVTGLSRSALDAKRKSGTWEYYQDWKKEGAKVLYNRQTLEAWNDSHKPRTRRKYIS